MDNRVEDTKDTELSTTKVGIDNTGQVVIKNRAWRRKFRNRAELEGRKSKKFYTKKKHKKRNK